MSRGPAHLSPTSAARGARAASGLALGVLLLAGCGSDDTTASDPETTVSPSATGESSPSAATSSADPSASTPPVDPSASATAFDLPACDAIWVAGATLPGGYQGCLAADGTPVDGAGTYCEFGKPIFTYARRFYAVANGPVTQTDGPLRADPQYRRAQRSCAG